jgi:hypothetical protein
VVAVARYVPAYCDPRTGLPRTWAHYINALRYVRMWEARQRIDRMHEALVAQAKPEDRAKWEDDLKEATGWPAD